MFRSRKRPTRNIPALSIRCSSPIQRPPSWGSALTLRSSIDTELPIGTGGTSLAVLVPSATSAILVPKSKRSSPATITKSVRSSKRRVPEETLVRSCRTPEGVVHTLVGTQVGLTRSPPESIVLSIDGLIMVSRPGEPEPDTRELVPGRKGPEPEDIMILHTTS